MADDVTSHIVKDVHAIGNVINDTDIGVDYLGHTIYAEALAKKIKYVSTPVSIGIFARWGSGKSFLVKHVKNLLKKYQQQNEVNEEEIRQTSENWRFRCCCHTILLCFFVILIIISGLLVIVETSLLLEWINLNETQAVMEPVTNSSEKELSETQTMISTTINWTEFWITHIKHISLAILIFSFALICFAVCCNNNWWFAHFYSSFRLTSYVAFTKLPLKNLENSIIRQSDEVDPLLRMDNNLKLEEKCTSSSLKRYIFVEFNAWEYAGCDTLWAGIVTNLSDAIEEEFGIITSRLFRMFAIETIPNESEDKTNKTNTLFVKLHGVSSLDDRESVLYIMTDYGAVCQCEKYATWVSINKKHKQKSKKKYKPVFDTNEWWVVRYSSSADAQRAKEDLSMKGIQVLCTDPSNFIDQPEISPDKNKRKHTEIEMENLIEEKSKPSENKASISNETQHGTSKTLRKETNKSTFFRHFVKYPKTTCKFPILFWWILIFFSGVTVPVITYAVAHSLELDVFRTPRSVPVAVQIFSWLPAAGAASFVVFKFIWAMCHSQRSRIYSALRGAKDDMAAELGFMDKVKKEVKFISKLIECVEFCHNTEYKIVLTIDDLDRVPLDKVKSVLEAVCILLSDHSSPFVCLIAVDSRIAVSCIEEFMGNALLKANMNGYEYLKKIINLPFCLPEISDDQKKKYINGLIDHADKTKRKQIKNEAFESLTTADGLRSFVKKESLSLSMKREPNSSKFQETNSPPVETARNSSFDETTLDAKTSESPDINANVVVKETDLRSKKISYNSGIPLQRNGTPISIDVIDGSLVSANESKFTTKQTGNLLQHAISLQPLNEASFLFACRDFFYSSDIVRRHLHGNPRNIKRIFNLLSLTALVIHCHEKQQHKQALLRHVSQETRSQTISVKCNVNNSNCSNEYINQEISRKQRKCLPEDFVVWIVLSDQWPYRFSYLLQVIEDADQQFSDGRKNEKIEEDSSLFDIYEKYVIPELQAIKSEDEGKNLMSLDMDPDLFYSFLKEIKDKGNILSKLKSEELKKYTVNLDQSLRQTIAYHRNLGNIKDAGEPTDTAIKGNIEANNSDHELKSENNLKTSKSNVILDVTTTDQKPREENIECLALSNPLPYAPTTTLITSAKPSLKKIHHPSFHRRRSSSKGKFFFRRNSSSRFFIHHTTIDDC